MVQRKRGGKRGGKRAGKASGRARKGRVGVRRRGFNEPEKASLTEVIPTGAPLAANQNYSNYNLSLANLPRAQNIAKGYQYYRIRRITYVIKPCQDTFLPGQNSVPYLYYMVDRTKQFVNGFTLDQLKAMEAKPHRLDDKTISFSMTPSVLTETFDNTGGANTAVQYKMSPWLPTKDIAQVGVWNPNTTDHMGIVWRVEQSFTTGGASAYVLERRVEIEFKKPSIPTAALGAEDVPQELDVDL